MTDKFIKNEQINFIRNQINLIKDSTSKNVPHAVLKAVKDMANAKILSLIPHGTSEQQNVLDIAQLKTDDEYHQYMNHLMEFVIPFPQISNTHLKKLFPKNKKLKLPDLSKIDRSQLTYFSWLDVSSNKRIIMYELEGELVGIESKDTPTSKKNICSFCDGYGEVTYFSTIVKEKKSKNPDYYKSRGNYICTDSSLCNKRITSVDYLTSYLKDVLAR
ncbi:elongation factor G-binding protein [Bacillus sp. BGMRC 2118]|nr:elongation factor G-binding protein [Bacillus sp. BGMRC 2118]